MADGVREMRVTFSEANYLRLVAWKERYEARHGSGTWADLLLAYANSKVLP